MCSSGPSDASYWRDKAIEYKRLLEDEKEEFKEFQLNSKELETELETQLELLEKNNADLQSRIEHLSIESETNKEKHDLLTAKLNREVTSLQEEVNTLKAEKLKQQQYIRQLEQVNDDLERSNRAAIASVEDIENRLNQVIEKNALLEVELYEKEELDVCVQRLKDEVRDLNQELSHRSRGQTSTDTLTQFPNAVGQSNIGTSEACIQTDNNRTPSVAVNPRSLTPSTRIAALNLVSDLLQKVAQLEANFAHVCRCYDAIPTKIAKFNDQPAPTSAANGV